MRPGFAHLPARFPHWHRQLWRSWWRQKSRHKGGRPRIAPDIIAQIRRLSLENPLWGAPRIHAELLREGIAVAQSTVSKYMIPRTGRPGQGWTTFIRNHASGIVAIDMLTVPSLGFGRLFAFIVLDLDRRMLIHAEVTDHPTALWLAREIAHALSRGRRPAFLIRDNDGAYGMTFRHELVAMGIVDRPTHPHSPWQNGHVERLIGSIRRECLDHVIILNAAHLRSILARYAHYYNNDRTHLALAKNAPNPRPIERDGPLKSRSILGGLHHRYYRDVQK